MTDDPLIAMRAGIDQAIAGASEMSRLLRGHFEAHVTAGFTDEQALALVLNLQTMLLRGEVGGEE